MDVKDAVTEALDAMKAKRVFGDPYERDGVAVIPAAVVRGGAGGGRGEEKQGAEPGRGSGFGLVARPVGAYVVKDGEVRWQPAIDVTRCILGCEAVAIVALMTLRSIVRARARARA